MGPTIGGFLVAHGLPAWLCPGYWTLAGLSALLGTTIALSLAEREGVPRHEEARAILVALVGALAGGYVFELVRAGLDAAVEGSVAPLHAVGRAAYGGLLGAIGASHVYLRWRGRLAAAFLDRAVLAAGVSFALVRLGCFIAGCDYGEPTSSPLGVHFPPHSLAAIDHVARGFVPDGARSLAVHPTELYEGSAALVAAVVAFSLRTRLSRAGDSFLVWISLYAVSRLCVESLRGDVSRGAYLGVSTAQWVSIGILVFAARVALGRYIQPPMPTAAPAPAARAGAERISRVRS